MRSFFKPGVPASAREQLLPLSRYELLLRIASGGMATVYLARARGPAGFSRIVAIKRAHRHLLDDPSFTRMLTTEARLASKIHHPNAVAVHDVEELHDELLLVMDYIEGPSLASLVALRAEQEGALAPAIAARVILDASAGLHAAHELVDEAGRSLGLVHRDVSPQNVLVGSDGTSRLVDFGIAKSTHGGGLSSGTTTGALKGKVGYMAPEYVESGLVDARSDVFCLGVVMWESLTGVRLFRCAQEIDTLRAVAACDVAAPSSVGSRPPVELDAVVLRALARRPEDRYPTAKAFGEELERVANEAGLLASHSEVATMVADLVGDVLDARRRLVREQLRVADSGPVTEPVESLEAARVTLPTPPPPDAGSDVDAASTAASERAAASLDPAVEAAVGTLASGMTRPSPTGSGRRRPAVTRRTLLGAAAAAALVFAFVALAWTRPWQASADGARLEQAPSTEPSASASPSSLASSSSADGPGLPAASSAGSPPADPEASSSTRPARASPTLRPNDASPKASAPIREAPGSAASARTTQASTAVSSGAAQPTAQAPVTTRPADKAPPNPYGAP